MDTLQGLDTEYELTNRLEAEFNLGKILKHKDFDIQQQSQNFVSVSDDIETLKNYELEDKKVTTVLRKIKQMKK